MLDLARGASAYPVPPVVTPMDRPDLRLTVFDRWSLSSSCWRSATETRAIYRQSCHRSTSPWIGSPIHDSRSNPRRSSLDFIHPLCMLLTSWLRWHDSDTRLFRIRAAISTIFAISIRELDSTSICTFFVRPPSKNMVRLMSSSAVRKKWTGQR